MAVDELIDSATELRRVEECGTYGEVYDALGNFYASRNSVFALIPGCEELVVDIGEELSEFVEDNKEDLFEEWANLDYSPGGLDLPEKFKEEYQKYLEEK